MWLPLFEITAGWDPPFCRNAARTQLASSLYRATSGTDRARVGDEGLCASSGRYHSGLI